MIVIVFCAKNVKRKLALVIKNCSKKLTPKHSKLKLFLSVNMLWNLTEPCEETLYYSMLMYIGVHFIYWSLGDFYSNKLNSG